MSALGGVNGHNSWSKGSYVTRRILPMSAEAFREMSWVPYTRGICEPCKLPRRIWRLQDKCFSARLKAGGCSWYLLFLSACHSYPRLRILFVPSGRLRFWHFVCEPRMIDAACAAATAPLAATAHHFRTFHPIRLFLTKTCISIVLRLLSIFAADSVYACVTCRSKPL